jgi:hypothetical protein
VTALAQSKFHAHANAEVDEFAGRISANAYCGDPRIAHLIVATGKALAMPPRMNSKPVTVVSLGRAWL